MKTILIQEAVGMIPNGACLMVGGFTACGTTTLEDVAEATLFCAAFPSGALTGQSLVVSHGWCMQ